MEIFSGTEDILIDKKSVITFGKFDGLHRGHQKLISYVRKVANRGLLSLVFSFTVSPLQVVNSKLSKQIITNEERKCVMESLGVDCFVEYPFTEQVMKMEAEDFVEKILVKKLHIAHAVIGPDFLFGYQRKGDAKLLKKLGQKWGFEVDVLEKESLKEGVVSSTRIRQMIEAGDMKGARELLGYPYFLRGQIVHGRQLGRTIGLPTLNQIPAKEKLLPPKGVYVTLTKIGNTYYKGISNVGEKPTVDGDFMGIETHLFDFSKEIYGAYADVFFLTYLRGEFKFASLEDLKAQIEKDKKKATVYLQDNDLKECLGILSANLFKKP
ncbi:MAG TPA: bifunctional riboflavin kinase/FAD synthetase [Lachnospiraceae bacterium]